MKKITNILKNKKEDRHPVISHHQKLTFGEKMSDKMTNGLGSWTFILIFIIFLLAWMCLNFIAWNYKWDPYPFILLNLVLSCLAALQAPVIMMSQNRQSERDRIAAKYDYAINRKSEREIEKVRKELESIKRLIRKIK